MVESYIDDKHSLYSQFSRFACDDACPRYGCRTDLIVGVSILEIYEQARLLKRPVLELFNLAYRLSPVVDEVLDKVAAFEVPGQGENFLSALSICDAIMEAGL